ncbi:hypothetical protein PSTG_05786 [Puccinia striiformis f. sp. tritici PST-78]|uniref:Uncharacterized protein n=1 Tax=Puccinia striiformis f. sp. tritici PST-78 TaxID=1165861 RepID=A0A0L0VNP1_9BASI|nr:hypothetical protein PSTG_05786 [Puccinia striiformis f. sp. tritici PST-78]
MDGTSPPNKDNENSTSSRSTQSALPLQSAFAELERSLPPLPDLERTHTQQDPIDLNMGVSPREVNPLATSLALASSASTPVPAYINRLEWNRPQSTAPPLIPLPIVPNQPTTPATNSAPPEIPTENRPEGTAEIPYVPPSELAKAMLDNQWYLFERARESQNIPLMRTALEQAISTQDLLTNLIGREQMLQVSEGWSARVEMDYLETSHRSNTNPPGQTLVPTQAEPMVLSTPHLPTANQQYLRPTPALNNQAPTYRTRRPTPDITYLGRTHSVTCEPLPPPPPPLIPPPTTHQAHQNQHVALRPTMHPQTYINQAPQPHFDQPQFHHQHHHPYAPRPQHNGGGRGRGWRRADPTVTMVRMGQSFERVERVLGRMNRLRGRGRGGRNPPYQQYQNQNQHQ